MNQKKKRFSHSLSVMSMVVAFFLSIQFLANAEGLPSGICPFQESAIKKNFSSSIQNDYGVTGIGAAFTRRENWYGGCLGFDAINKHRFRLKYKTAEIVLNLQFKRGKIEQFGFEQVAMKNDTWERFDSFLKNNWPRSSYLVQDSGAVHGFQENNPLNVGEGRILLILKAIEGRLAQGALRNDQLVRLRSQDKVQEIDELASKPDGFSISVEQLKEKALDGLDRTAGDILFGLVGRAALEEGREFSVPFLSRRQFAWLMTLSPQELASIKKADAIISASKIDRPQRIPPLPSERYDHLDKFEWRATSRELCDSVALLGEVPAFRNMLPSRTFQKNHAEWEHVFYYAARDFGVAQTSFRAMLPGRKSPTCLTLILNSGGFLDEDAAGEIFDRLISLFSRSDR